MLRVGLSGGIGSGKSTVSARLAELGADTVDGHASEPAPQRDGDTGPAGIGDEHVAATAEDKNRQVDFFCIFQRFDNFFWRDNLDEMVCRSIHPKSIEPS